MAEQDLSITPPSITQSASIATIGKSWNAVGVTGAASFDLPLPWSAGRGFDPGLSLTYNSQSGNGPFGLGWQVGASAISRRTRTGVPRYQDDDVMLGPDGEEWRPRRNAQGEPDIQLISRYRGLNIGEHRVVEYYPRTQRTFERMQFWRSTQNPRGFWLVHSGDGSLHAFGMNDATRSVDPRAPERVAIWHLQESLNPRGEHIAYEYKAEPTLPQPGKPHDYQAQRYLHRVLYGNAVASDQLHGWNPPTAPLWHLHLLFDYGERNATLDGKPLYGPPYDAPGSEFGEWTLRSDPFHSYAFGFEIGTRRLCRQVLMFHHFPGKTGANPALGRRLLLEYRSTSLGYSQLQAAHYQAYDASGAMEAMPPVEFDYSTFEPETKPQPFFAFESMPGVDDGQRYQCVDLFGEGVPGFLCRHDQSWYYREPLRGDNGANAIAYGPWTALARQPSADASRAARQVLLDMTGDGRLDWVIAQPGNSGFHRLNADRSWSGFLPFAGFPPAFFHAMAQLGDLSGDGLESCALIGPNSVRLYASRRDAGFAPAEQVDHAPAGDRLPLLSNSRSELVLLSHLLGSDMPELCRIRCDEIKCWPNLGHGRFGEGFVLNGPTFDYASFDAARVRIADLDGSGAPALIYLQSTGFEVYFNRGGNGLQATPLVVPWPDGVRYDNLCQVTLADLQGLGCASLILSVPHMTPRHWRYDLVAARPYLLTASNNNMGLSTEVVYRSSAQEWLDQKPAQNPVCHLPFAVQLVSQQQQLDEITGNRLSQHFRYADAYYDGRNREFRGFGQVQQIDSEAFGAQDDETFSEPSRTCTWYHTGRLVDLPRDGFFHDPSAIALNPTLLCRWHAGDAVDETISVNDETTAAEVARALAGAVRRIEQYAAADDPTLAVPFAVEEHRYKVRQLHAAAVDDGYSASWLPLPVETISYQYERLSDDPLCRHDITLTHDGFGQATHHFAISYARRLTELDAPPFNDPDQQAWWRDAHDPAQQSYYLSESRSEFIHLSTQPDEYRLGLAYRQRGNALVLPKGRAPVGLEPKDISHEGLTLHQASDAWNAARVLSSQSQQRYLSTADRTLLPPGSADFEALSGPLEIAQLDETALAAYADLPPPFNLREELALMGYRVMPTFLEPSDAELWSADYNFATYGGLEAFYQVTAFHHSVSHGQTLAEYDDVNLRKVRVELPDGCATRVEYDYYALQPLRLIDANDNVQEALYEPSGQPIALSFYGTENGVEAGFKPLAEHVRPADPRPGPALDNPAAALQDAAHVLRKDLFSWMGELPALVGRDAERLQQWIAAGDVLPSGHIRASTRRRLARLARFEDGQQPLLKLINAAPREPVHSALLSADQFPGGAPAQIHISLVSVDGFGRVLQTRQQVEPGPAYQVDANNELVIDNGQPVEAFADPRWRVSERVEYNNKGLAVRVFRPYFANRHAYVRDASLRAVGPHDRQFYDALGRPAEVINAKGHLARQTRHPWYQINEDFNDTWAPSGQTPKEPPQ